MTRVHSLPSWTVAPALCAPLATLRLAWPGLTLLQLPGGLTTLGLVLSPLAAPLLLLLLNSGLLMPPTAWKWLGRILALGRSVLLCSALPWGLRMLSLPGLATLLLCTRLLLHRALLCGTRPPLRLLLAGLHLMLTGVLGAHI